MGSEQRISVRVIPRSSVDEVVGWDDGSRELIVRVKAAPVDNAANEATTKAIAKALKVPKFKVRIVAGAKSRNKTIAIDGDPSVYRDSSQGEFKSPSSGSGPHPRMRSGLRAMVRSAATRFRYRSTSWRFPLRSTSGARRP